ncbi:hypothetical protein GCK72_009960 [Caenorhabditis remanei]|uniref:Uncharacterized protein n=1 Tax=Caenorhabditis remanei TaxID=31234 RepID=A0A6A5H4M8_CAERE|nr:hypothetical protein GCK72_009960 [Caenorhabditis remanei]KAF1761704.1 hypothetical protein GCK72_009960 [Caenorhabditis remanei]
MPAILSRLISASEEKEATKKEDSETDGSSEEIPHVTRRESRRQTVIIPVNTNNARRESSLPIDDSILEILHEEYKSVSAVLCISHIYIFLAGTIFFFLLSLFQIGIQCLFFSRFLLKNPFTRKILFLLSMTFMTVGIISMGFLKTTSQVDSSIGYQILVYFFYICAFIGFVFTNMYNVSMVFVFGRDVKWLLHNEHEDENEEDISR